MDSRVTIRHVDDDAEAVASITSQTFGQVSIDAAIEKAFGRGGASWTEIKCNAVCSELTANPDGCFVAEMDGQVVGYVTTIINEPASRGTISNLAVSPACQGRGVGRKLLDRAIEHFRELGLAQARIETLECNEVGRHLYPKLGFKEVVRQIHYVMPLS